MTRLIILIALCIIMGVAFVVTATQRLFQSQVDSHSTVNTGATGTPATQPTETVLNSTVPVFIEHEHDKVSAQFVIANPFDRPVSLVNVHKPCACSEAKLDRTELQPGECTTLSVSASVYGKFGKQTVVVLVV